MIITMLPLLSRCANMTRESEQTCWKFGRHATHDEEMRIGSSVNIEVAY